jgi:hypothetical protein
MSSILMNQQKPDPKKLVVTKTGEPHQPVRIYYQVYNRKTLMGVFKKLRCMIFNAAEQSWMWSYEQEAKKLRFDIAYNAIAKADRPILLGTFSFPTDDQMLLDLRSIDRALYALEFFGKRVNHRVAEATRLRVVNRFFSAEELLDRPFQAICDGFFNRKDVKVPNPNELEAKLQEINATYSDSEEKDAAVMTFLEENARQPLSEVEELPIHFQEEGVEPLAMALKMRQIEAFEHWQGNTQFSQFDIIQSMMALDEFEDDEVEDDEIEEDKFEEDEASSQ